MIDEWGGCWFGGFGFFVRGIFSEDGIWGCFMVIDSFVKSGIICMSVLFIL